MLTRTLQPAGEELRQSQSGPGGTISAPMDPVRISTLLRPFLVRTLAEVQLRQISTYIDLLLRWNARINLTAIRDPEEIVTRHFGESLFLARHLFPQAGRSSVERAPSPASPKVPAHPPKPETQPTPTDPPFGTEKEFDNMASADTSAEFRVLDIGSGAGFPGIPIKLWAPNVSLTLVESNHKKATFLREVIRALTLTGVNVITARAETLLRTHPLVDVVTLRAVEHFDAILATAARLVAPTGRLAVMIGSAQLPELATLLPNLRWQAPVQIPQSSSRLLSISVPN